MDNIILIGMPGCGKSTVGVVLAKALGYSFLDSDLLIQEREKKLLFEILDEAGFEGFNQIENEVNSSINTNRTVVATGGSVVYGREAMEHLKNIGTVFYLKLSLPEIKERLGDLHERGVSMKNSQSLSDLYLERIPLYEKYADVVIDAGNKSIREIVGEIIRNYKTKS